jgi:hypothetical protein
MDQVNRHGFLIICKEYSIHESKDNIVHLVHLQQII